MNCNISSTSYAQSRTNGICRPIRVQNGVQRQNRPMKKHWKNTTTFSMKRATSSRTKNTNVRRKNWKKLSMRQKKLMMRQNPPRTRMLKSRTNRPRKTQKKRNGGQIKHGSSAKNSLKSRRKPKLPKLRRWKRVWLKNSLWSTSNILHRKINSTNRRRIGNAKIRRREFRSMKTDWRPNNSTH